MKQKINKPTPQRQDNSHVLDDEFVMVSFDEIENKIKTEPSWKDSDRNA